MAVLAIAASHFYSTGPGKLSVWEELLRPESRPPGRAPNEEVRDAGGAVSRQWRLASGICPFV
jgi:hypothetical protein